MEWVALAIVLSTCLYLIDKNQKWRSFRRFVLWSVAAGILMVAAYILWDQHEAQKALLRDNPPTANDNSSSVR